MKNIALFILILCSSIGFSQDPVLNLDATLRDDDTGKKLTGATIEVYQDGKLFATKTSGSNGKVPIIDLPLNHNYTVYFKKDGYVTKVANIDASHPNPEDLNPFLDFDMQISLFQKVEDVDFNWLETTPMIKFSLDKFGFQTWDKDYTNDMLKKIDKLKDEIADKKKEEAKKRAEFERLVANGDKAMKAEDYLEAVNQYIEALVLFDDAEVQTKLDDANAKLKDAEAGEQAQLDYEAKMEQALADYEAKSYESALSLYKEALKLMPNEQAPKTKISEIEKILAQQKEDEAAFNKYIKDGDSDVGSEKYDEAIANYEGALGLREGDPDATAKLENAKKLKADKENADADAQKLEEEYNQLMADAQAAFDKESYEDARAKYEEAKNLKADESKPQSQIDKIDDILAKLKAEEEALAAKEKEYTDKMAEAQAKFDAKSYEDALALYVEASAMKPDNPDPKAKIQEIDDILKKREADEEAFNKFVQDGDKGVDEENFDTAISSYESALGLRSGDAGVTAKLENAKALQKAKQDDEAEAKAKEEEYNKLMADAQVDFTNNDYEGAKAKYEKAKALKPDEIKPQVEIERINDILDKLKSEQEAQAKIDAEYDKIVKEADALFDSKEWIKAKVKYEEAHSLKMDEQWPMDRIALANQEIENDKLSAKRDEDYQNAMDQANKFFDEKNYVEARSKYNIASGLKSQEQEPKDRITEIDQLLSDQANSEEKEANYLKAMKEGTSLKDNKDYVAALTSFNSALTYKPDDKEALDKIAEVNELIDADQSAKDAEDRFNDFVRKGDTKKNGHDYDGAIENYKSALEIKEDQGLRDKIAAIEKLKASDSEKEQLDADYDAAIQEGANLFAAEDYEGALVKYKEANKLKSGELLPIEKISEIESHLGDMADKDAKEQKFNEFVSRGDDFYANKEYDKALDQYKEAIKVKPDPAISQKITDINLLMHAEDQDAETEKLYKAKIAEAKIEFDAKNWVEAKNRYNEAIAIKGDETFPVSQIKEIDRLMGDESLNNQYDSAIKRADKLRDEKSYDEAISAYEEAKSIKPGESYPQSQIDLINKLKASNDNDQAEKDRLEQEYQDLISKANAAYTSDDFKGALISYKEAIKLRPTDNYVQGRIDDINSKLLNNEEAKLQAEYDGYIEEGNTKFNAGEYLESVPFFEKALGVLPNEQYPKDKIAEAERLASESSVTEVDKNYSKIVSKADEYFDADNFVKAKELYNRALTIKPSDEYPKNRLDEIRQIELNKSKNALRKEYDDIMLLADAQFEQGNWKDAKELYEKALTIIADEQYPKDQINRCIKNMKSEGVEEINVQYNKIIAKADEYYDAKNYPKAKNLYERAVNIKPSDVYPKDQLAEIDRILHPEKYLANSHKPLDRGTPINATDLDMEALLKEAKLEKNYKDGQFTVRLNEEIEKIETDWTGDQEDETTAVKDEVETLSIDIEENIAEGDEKREESLIVIEKLENDIEEELTDWGNSQDEENLSTKEEVEELEIDIEENVAISEEKREDSNLEVVELQDELGEQLREYGKMNENDIQQQNQVVTNLHTDIEERNETNDLPREEYIADMELMQLEIKYENESNSNTQENNNHNTNENVDKLQTEHISNDPDNDIDRKNTEVHVEDFEVTLLNKRNGDGWDQENEINKVVDQNELLTDERFAEDVDNDIDRIENVKEVENLYSENENYEKHRSNDQYDATIDGKKYQENLMTEININNNNNDIPRQNMETHVEETEVGLENNLSGLSSDQDDVLYESDETIDNLEIEIEEEFEDADLVRENYEETIEDVNLEIQDYQDDLNGDSDDDRFGTVNYTEGMTDDKKNFDKNSDDKINDAIDNTNEAVDDILEENNRIGEENTNKINETEDYIENMQSIDVNAVDQEMQNQLGKDFPEGVTEEVYEYKDEDGLLEKFVVRRIVVVNGVGYVYEKVMTRYGTTSYSRNGDGITEFQWDEETNNADLTRN